VLEALGEPVDVRGCVAPHVHTGQFLSQDRPGFAHVEERLRRGDDRPGPYEPRRGRHPAQSGRAAELAVCVGVDPRVFGDDVAVAVAVDDRTGEACCEPVGVLRQFAGVRIARVVVAAVDASLVRSGRTHEQVVVALVQGDVRTRTSQVDRGGSSEEPAADDSDPHGW
jgi:hypothetical protein